MKRMMIVLFVLLISVTAFADTKLTINGGYNINTADVASSYTSGGLSLQAKVLFSIDKDLSWGFETGFFTFWTGDNDAYSRCIPVLGMLQYNFLNDGQFSLFGNAGFGLYMGKADLGGSWGTLSSEDAGVELGVGFEYKVSPTVGLGAEVQMHYILNSSADPQITLLGGVTFHL